jgi:hypothetical protein
VAGGIIVGESAKPYLSAYLISSGAANFAEGARPAAPAWGEWL